MIPNSTALNVHLMNCLSFSIIYLYIGFGRISKGSMHIHFPVLNFSKLFIPKLDKHEFIYWFKQLKENDFRSVPHASLNKLFVTKSQRLPWHNIELVMLKK